MKLQAAFEYLVIVGIVLGFLIPMWVYISSLQQETNTELSLTYAENAAKKIADTADLVFSQGPPARVELNVYIPKFVEEINITNNTIIFKVLVSGKTSDIIAISSAKLNGTLPIREGTYTISVEAKDDFVQITQET